MVDEVALVVALEICELSHTGIFLFQTLKESLESPIPIHCRFSHPQQVKVRTIDNSYFHHFTLNYLLLLMCKVIIFSIKCQEIPSEVQKPNCRNWQLILKTYHIEDTGVIVQLEFLGNKRLLILLHVHTFCDHFFHRVWSRGEIGNVSPG